MAPQVTYLFLAQLCDNFPFGPAAETYYQLFLTGDDEPHGYMLPEIVHKMPWTEDWDVHHDHPRCVTLRSQAGIDHAVTVNQAFASLVELCITRNLFKVISGRHSEPFAITSARYSTPVHVERFATNLFGLTTRGAHMIAYNNADQGMKIWVSRRAKHIFTYPGMLDSTVGGGVKAGVSPFQTIVEEAHEEASLPGELIRSKCRCRGALTHVSVTGEGFAGEPGLVNPDMIWVYDIELPIDIVPKPFDEEVGDFYLMSIPEVQAALLNEEFKPDAACVMIDFLMRQSYITPENEKDYVEISMSLHRKLPFRTGGQ